MASTRVWAVEVASAVAEVSAFMARPKVEQAGMDLALELDCTATGVEGCIAVEVEDCIVAEVEVHCIATVAGSSKDFGLGRLAFESGLANHERSCGLLPDGRYLAWGCIDHSEGCRQPCGRSP